jgi:FixJ family two-component response regulator
MLTGRGSHQVDLEAMQAGAADYLVKGHIEPEDIERSIRYALGRMEAQQALRASEGCSATFHWVCTGVLLKATSWTPIPPW